VPDALAGNINGNEDRLKIAAELIRLPVDLINKLKYREQE